MSFIMHFKPFMNILQEKGWTQIEFDDTHIYLTNPNSYLRISVDIANLNNLKYNITWSNGEDVGVVVHNGLVSELDYNKDTGLLTRPNTKYIDFFNIDQSLDIKDNKSAPITYGKIIDSIEEAISGKEYVFSNDINEIVNNPEKCKLSYLQHIRTVTLLSSGGLFNPEDSECGIDELGEPYVCSFYKYIREVIRDDIRRS